MRFQNALENARLALTMLLVAFIAAFILNILLVMGWYRAQSTVTVYLPPQIPQAGTTLQAGEYPETTIYSFAYYIWQSINYWPNNGTQDYQQTLQQFSSFLTPRFKAFLIHDYNERSNQSELQERLRTLSGLNGVVFDKANVQSMGHGVWIVHLKMRLSEHINSNASQVKDVAIEYVLRVVRHDVDVKSNPWGLALDGFVANPQRIQTFI